MGQGRWRKHFRGLQDADGKEHYQTDARGFRGTKTNMYAPDDLINKIKNQPELFIKKVHDLAGDNMRFNAVVGNPPYQEVVAQKDTDNGQNAVAVFSNISR